MISQRFIKLTPLAAIALAAITSGCSGTSGQTTSPDGGPDGGPDDVAIPVDHVSTDIRVSSVVVTVSPATASVAAGGTQAFAATVTGATNPGVTWYASGGSISADGVFTAPASGGTYVITASSVEDPVAAGTALISVSGGSASVIEPFYSGSGPYVQIMTPIPNVTYFAPATIRLWANAPYLGADGVNGYANSVDFYFGTMMVGSAVATQSGGYDMYQVDVTNVAAGTYEISAKAHAGSTIVESQHIPVTVIAVPAHSSTMTLTSDLVLSGSTNLDINGTASDRALITSSNGSRIRSASGWSGHITIQNADIIGLGSMQVPGIEVTTSNSGGITITNSIFDRTGPPSFTANGSAPIVFTGNTLQPNILTKVNHEADYGDGSQPSLYFAGDSSAPKLFQGNNVGVSFVRFYRTSHWTVGGNTDAAGNVLIGVRAGMEFSGASDITVRGNISYHRYPFGWSQGQNLFFDGMGQAALVEHNMLRGGSWMVQSFLGEFRYNLMVDNINEAFFRDARPNSSIHHNVLANVGYSRTFYPTCGVRSAGGTFYNNTVDMGGKMLGWTALSFISNVDNSSFSLTSVRNNVFTGFAYEHPYSVVDAGDATSADYNLFYNPDTTMLTGYGSSGLGAHDVGGGASTNPKFAQARVIPFPIGDGDIWQRKVTISQILALYRSIYTPAATSPLIDAGDPRDDTGGARNTDIGAVGAGVAHPDDLFGRFAQ